MNDWRRPSAAQAALPTNCTTGPKGYAVTTLERTTGADPRSRALREEMDAETFGLYTDYFASLAPEIRERLRTALHTEQADLVEVVIAVDDGMDVGHAALRALADGGFEVKKVFVRDSARARGLSRILMAEVEQIARDRGESRIVLQTGPQQLAAIALYRATRYGLRADRTIRAVPRARRHGVLRQNPLAAMSSLGFGFVRAVSSLGACRRLVLQTKRP